jgi:SAM-dependent methyltransferase
MSYIDYDHKRNVHSLEGAVATLSAILTSPLPRTLLDIGCGTGTWLRAAIDLGVTTVVGIDGVRVPQEDLEVAEDRIEYLDLSEPFDLKQRFDLVLCLEVAEHLPQNSSCHFVSSIVAHSDLILFSAACPGQPGQHHINCQWPVYWQRLFNEHAFTCDDSVRWKIWDDARIPPWYRQNIFWARRDSTIAGLEPRLKGVVHPEFLPALAHAIATEGQKPAARYGTAVLRAAASKLRRLFTP